MHRSQLFAAIAGAAVLSTAACGGSDTNSTGGAGGSSTTTSTSTSTTSTTTTTISSSTTTTTTTTTTTGTGFCAGAMDIVFGDYLSGDLVTTGQKDLYRFTGQKGQVVEIDIDAQYFDNAQFDPDHIDPVVTLFDDQGKQLAQNNDPLEYSTGDSRLYTILPADGEYCIRMADCWSVIANPAQACDAPKDKLFTPYAIYLAELVDAPADSLAGETESGDDVASANVVEYEADSNGYYTSTLWGTFRDQEDIDVWTFTLPTDLSPEPPLDARTTGLFYLMSSGTGADGSTSPTGRVWVADATAPDVILASVDAAKNPRFFPRLELGKPYLLFVTRPQGMTGANDFYFFRHSPSWGNTLELEGTATGMNDTPATAEVLLVDGLDAYVEGDLSMGAKDVDHFLATVPSGATTVGVSCVAQRYGSGLRGFKASFLKTDGTPLAAGASDTETETNFAGFSGISVGSETDVVLKIEASSQDPNVAEAFYLCGVHFK